MADRVTLAFREEFAVLHMKDGENRLNQLMLNDLNEALDQVERYSTLRNEGFLQLSFCIAIDPRGHNYQHLRGN